jgi:hypothetical protein
MKGKGDELPIIVQDLAIKYKVRERQIYRDWEIRDRWLPEILGLEDIKLFDLELMGRLENVYQLAVKEYFKAKQDSVRLGCLRLVMDVLTRMKKFSVDHDVILQIEEIKDWIHKQNLKKKKSG